MKLPRFVKVLLGVTQKEREQEIEASDKRITECLVEGHKLLTAPDTTQAQVDAASVQLKDISINFKKAVLP